MALRYSHKLTLESGTTITIDHSIGYNQYRVVLAHDAELSITNFQDTETMLLIVEQDETGGRTLELDGELIDLFTEPGQITMIGIVRDGTNNLWDSNAPAAPPAPDETAPTVVSATAIDATTIRVVFDEVVNGTNVGFAFKKNGDAHNPTAVSGSGTDTFDFTVPTMVSTDVLLRSYDSATGDTVDGSGNELESFTDAGVTNAIPSDWEEVIFTGADLDYTSGILTTTSSDAAYGHTGLGDKYLPADVDGSLRVQYKTDARSQIIGFNTANSAESHTGFEVGFYVNTSNIIIKKDGGANTSTGISVTADQYIRVTRIGSVWKIQKSDNGTDWTDVVTLTYSNTAAMYPVVDFIGNTQKLYYPMGLNLLTP